MIKGRTRKFWDRGEQARVAAVDAPVPFNKGLEQAFFPQIDDIELAARRLVEY